MAEPDEITVTLRPSGDGPPAAVRFKRALKSLLRDFKLTAHWPGSPDRRRPQDGKMTKNSVHITEIPGQG